MTWDMMSGYKHFTFTAEAAVFLINPFDVPDGLNILTVFAHSHDAIGLLERFRAGETTHKMQFVLHTNANTHYVFTKLHTSLMVMIQHWFKLSNKHHIRCF